METCESGWTSFFFKDRIEVAICHRRKPERKISESFADALSKRMMELILEKTGVTYKQLKKYKCCFWYGLFPEPTHYYFGDRSYFEMCVENGDFRADFWVAWYVKGYNWNQLRSVHVCDDVSDMDIVFEMLDELPKSLADADRNRFYALYPIDKEFQKIADEVIINQYKSSSPDNWEEERAREIAYNEMLRKMTWDETIRYFFDYYTEREKMCSRNRKYSFKFEIISSSSDVNLIIEFSEEGKVNKEKTKKKLDRLFSKYLDETEINNGDGLRYYDYNEEAETENCFSVYMDFGGFDPEFVFYDIMKKLHQAKLGITRVLFS